MPRFLGHYVRDLQLTPIEQAVRKVTSLPAQRERLLDRSLLKEGYFADVPVFDPATIRDTATYTNPARLSEGVKYVFVNAALEFEGGQLTGIRQTVAWRWVEADGVKNETTVESIFYAQGSGHSIRPAFVRIRARKRKDKN